MHFTEPKSLTYLGVYQTLLVIYTKILLKGYHMSSIIKFINILSKSLPFGISSIARAPFGANTICSSPGGTWNSLRLEYSTHNSEYFYPKDLFFIVSFWELYYYFIDFFSPLDEFWILIQNSISNIVLQAKEKSYKTHIH